jgi:hypothetical protein
MVENEQLKATLDELKVRAKLRRFIGEAMIHRSGEMRYLILLWCTARSVAARWQ